MKYFFLLLFSFSLYSFSQQNEIWHSYYDKITELKGFKNSKGNVVLEPKYGVSTVANKFDKVIAVSEMDEKNELYDSYYLLKNGKKFGRDSLYVNDFIYACESEGFIKFKDHKKDLIGFFDSEAKVVIPAEYNTATQIKNGIFVALKNSKKEYWDNSEHSGCQHWSWKGGNECLVDYTNTILVNNFKFNRELNYYSMEISTNPINTSIRDNFLGVDGKYYSFINNKKEFEVFFHHLLNKISLKKLYKNSFEELVYIEKNRWTYKARKQFFEEYGEKIIKRFKMIKSKKENVEYSIQIEDYTPVPEHLEYLFDERRDNCGQLDVSKYPLINVLITYKDKNKKYLFQDHFYFIKIDNEFKLLSAVVKN